MGKNADGSIRMITEDNVTTIPWSTNEVNFETGESTLGTDYDTSHAQSWLNNYFYSKLKDKDVLVSSTWCSQKVSDTSSKRKTCTNNLSKLMQPIGLVSVDEFNLAGASNSYLNNNQHTSTINSSNDSIYYINEDGNITTNGFYASGLRPIINLSQDVLVLNGDGTIINPYMIENKSIEENGNLNSQSRPGEYVLFAGRTYRVVDTSNDGTKIILDGFVDSDNDG